MTRKLKTQERSAPLTDAVAEAISLLTELGEECRDVADNAPEATQSSARIEALAASGDALADIEEPDAPDAVDTSTVVSWTDALPSRPSRPLSRAARCANAVQALSAAVAGCDEQLDALEHTSTSTPAAADEIAGRHDAIEEYRDALQQIVDDAEDCEFPGMFG